MKKLFAILLVVVMIAGIAACSNNQNTNPTPTPSASESAKPTEAPKVQGVYDNEPALVLGSEEFNGVFSPFYGSTEMDRQIYDLVHPLLLGFDRFSMPDDTGLAYYENPEEVKGADGKVEKTIYTFKLKDGLVFSDGKPLTADDVMFTLKVFCDPNYAGEATVYTSPILGVNEYRYDDKDYKAKIEKMRADADTYEPTQDEINAKADELAVAYKDYGVTKEDLMPGGVYYEDETLFAIREAKYAKDEAAYISGNLSDGMDIPEIEGIKKIDDKTVQITIEGVDPKAIYNFGAIEICPAHYYGVGFKKGDLSMVQAKNGTPMGAGPYRFVSFENNVVTLVANDFFYKGAPKIKKIKFQVIDTSNKLESVRLGDIDISDPTASPDMVKEVEATDNIHYELIDNLGYGYIGINAERITDKNVRKGIMHLMDRKPAVQAYYGNLASVIERPISRVSWAYPKDATEVYGFNTSKALEYFLAAGYKQEGGKLMKDGKQLTFDIAIPADGTGDHPSYPIVLGVKTEAEKLGAKVNLLDYADGNLMFDDLDAGKLDIWCAAWQATPDPDMYQTYYSTGPSNHYKIKNEKLDQLIMDGRGTSNIDERKKIYGEAMDIIMDEAVEMPIYQRKNMYIFNKDIINVETLPKDMTPYYGYFAEIENLQLTAEAK